MNKHGFIIATRGGRTIRTSPVPAQGYPAAMKDLPIGRDWTFTIFASLIIIGVTLTVLILGYLNIRSL
ncbi:MAG: hypothetical protein EBZ05_05840 [Verrucomicrobia bacterium]|nr:hypothetical protein [Verrucomicrobiota bacterium]